ncbi:MAG: leucyl aminopeptidase [Anaerolineales bacterium]|nr:leucyl aminopeptidase [Anaerolineales bacterium]
MPTFQLTFSPVPNPLNVSLQSGQTLGELEITDRGITPRQLTFYLGEAITPEKMRQAGGHLANWLVAHPEIEQASVDLSPLKGLFGPFFEGLYLGGFRFDRYKTKTASHPPLNIHIHPVSEESEDVLAHANLITSAQNLAREWGHEPPNVINPHTLAARCETLAADLGLKYTVLDDQQLEEMGAGAIVAVGKASQTPSRLIILEYAGTQPQAKPVVVVGKAITFDTGGYTIKTRDGMVGMKYDKCGAMAVIGLMQAAAQLKVAPPVVGIIAAAENMIAGNAYRPNDIITTLSGQTVEIISADAEGRMVLADALTFACRNFQPRAVIDLATLTGGVGVALGEVRAGLMSNNDTLADALYQAGERTYERLWRLPLDDEYLDLIKGDDSDFKNSGGAKASAIIGGMFLKQFVTADVPWAHLDIASVAFPDKAGPYRQKGASGFGVRLLVDFLETNLLP